MAKKRVRRRQTVKLPDDSWKQSFQSSTMRTNFNLNLSQTMIEFLCAVADDVQWDRSLYYPNIHAPDNLIASSRALIKRGLIESLSQEESHRRFTEKWRRYQDDKDSDRLREVSYYSLTPAGEALVELLKVAGVFIEADAAINKRSRRA